MAVATLEQPLTALRQCCRLAGEAMRALLPKVQPGVTTEDLDVWASTWIVKHGGVPSFKDYRGYPKHICVSVNEEVVHGVPGHRKIKDGDVVSVDLGILKDGWFSDLAATVAVGSVSEDRQKLIRVTREAMYRGIRQAKAGRRIGDISFAVQSYVESEGCSVVRDYIGHGIGRSMHEDPQVPNFGQPGRGPMLKSGMAICIEPMVNLGRPEVNVLKDGWTAVTRDGLPSAHFEHTVLITDGEPEILTQWEDRNS